MAPSGKKAGLGRFVEGGKLRAVLAILGIAIVVGGIAWKISHEVDVVFGVLGALAVVLAAIQFADARNTLGNIRTIGSKLEDSTHRVDQIHDELAGSTERLEEQLSTRRIGRFPTFLPTIVKLLESAKHSVVVFCDTPAYGVLSEPDSFKNYARAIADQGDRVGLLCLDRHWRRRLAEDQIDKGASDWESWRSDHRDQIRAYLSSRGKPATCDTIQRDEFIRILLEGAQHVLDDAFSSAEKFETPLVMPLYFWIVDGERAVFALAPLLQPDELEVGFRTDDRHLIKALEGIFKRYRSLDQTQEAESRAGSSTPMR
jgi:hypothetical protein